MAESERTVDGLERKWHRIGKLAEGIYLLSRSDLTDVYYSLMATFTIRLCLPRKQLVDGSFALRYQSLDEIESMADRLRWLRLRHGWKQIDVAQMIGVSRATYIDLETGVTDYCPAQISDKLAELYGLTASELLDAYNLFLYGGQGKIIRRIRSDLGLNQKQFAAHIGAAERSVGDWERERKRLSKSSWDKYFSTFRVTENNHRTGKIGAR